MGECAPSVQLCLAESLEERIQVELTNDQGTRVLLNQSHDRRPRHITSDMLCDYR